MTATSKQIIEAAADAELRERIIALAAQLPEVENPAAVVSTKLLKIVGVDITVNGEPSSIAKVYEYAVDTHLPHMATPGSNPGAVTDDHIRAALEAVLQTPAPTGAGS